MSWSHTLHLPASRLAARSNAKLVAQNLERVTTDLYRWQAAQADRPARVLHDGPPYANGELHMGHALNKILKDIIIRHAVNTGARVEYVPGWDCHGLPIEHSALKKVKGRGRGLTPVQRRALARKLAEEMVAKQKEGFVGFGVMADWKDPAKRYLTMSTDYVARELRVFATLVEKNLVFRQRKPVFWSVESGTALAESELEYGEHTSTDAYLTYPLVEPLAGLTDVSLAVWTTTPWTLPANQAVAVNKDITYCVAEVAGKKVVVAEALLPALRAAVAANASQPQQQQQQQPALLASGISGSELAGRKYTCPLRQTDQQFPIIVADHVTDSAGTGLVHTAPGHGKEDFVAGLKNGLAVASPVDGRGKYTPDVAPAFLAGLDARAQGTPAVLAELQKHHALLASSKMNHSVPLDWRTKTPVMVRSTPQFFIDLGNEIRDMALEALDKVSFRPEAGKQRLQAFTQSRSDWCISRQRAWGVPIPAIYNKATDEPVFTQECIQHIVARIERLGAGGVDSWFAEENDIEAWLPPSMQNQGLGTQFRKGQDTLDVWLDSGSSWTMLDKTPADFYLEGSDQHRGWFQSSLLTHVAVTGKPAAPFSRLITHGFVLDEKRQKMSKSLGNTVSPQQLMQTLGIDGLRLLVAQSDYTSDIALSATTTSQVAAMVKKFRLTFKYLLGNLADYTGDGTLPAHAALSALDVHAENQLGKLVERTRAAYDEQNFQSVVKHVQAHMSSELSALYFDAVKDILYADQRLSPRRQAAQYVLWNVLSTYVRMLAPIIPLLTQEVWDLCPASVTTAGSSPLMAGFPPKVPVTGGEEASAEVERGLQIRELVNDAIEKARTDKRVGSSLACDIYINLPNEAAQVDPDLIATICIASHVSVNSEPPHTPEWSYASEANGIKVQVVPPSHHKCPRCWKYQSPDEDQLCGRCEKTV